MTIKELTTYLESLAPLSTQESYDNCGLIVGDASTTIDGVLVTLDCTEEVIEEAKELGVKLVVAHHPIVFKGLKSFTGKNYVERTVLKAIKYDIAIYAIHTNLDNYLHGVNAEIANRIGLLNTRILAPKSESLLKFVVYVPQEHLELVRDAIFNAGAGSLGNYSECSFAVAGKGTFKPQEDSDPSTGEIGVRSYENELRLEVLVPSFMMNRVLQEVRNVHPYEEVAYEFYPILNVNQELGSGMIGELAVAEEPLAFLKRIKNEFNAGVVKFTKSNATLIKKVALCGGSGSFLIKEAMRSGADVFITGDVKYHEFFDAENKMIIADIGHYESEQFTSNRLEAIIKEKFPKFAVHLTRTNTNPINYL